jgi:hypothetical protein
MAVAFWKGFGIRRGMIVSGDSRSEGGRVLRRGDGDCKCVFVRVCVKR